MMEVRHFVRENGKKPFDEWLTSLKDRQGKSRVIMAISRMQTGLFGDFKSVGDGVQESRIHCGAGYRIYFSFDGSEIIILLAGSDKSDQKKVIAKAKEYLVEYDQQKAAANNEVKKGAKS